MTGTLVLAGLALVILAAAATRIKEARRIYRRQIPFIKGEWFVEAGAWPLESDDIDFDVPVSFVSHENGNFFEEFTEAVNIALWEDELR